MSTDDWVITATFNADPAMEQMDEWESRLEALDGSVGRRPAQGVVDVTVYAPGGSTLFEAITKTLGEVVEVVRSEPVALEVVTEHERARAAEAPTMPELMSAAEIADELGVRRQRVHQLRRDKPAFPAPLAELRGGAVWDAAAVRKFAESWTRKPGRPRMRRQANLDYCAAQGRGDG